MSRLDKRIIGARSRASGQAFERLIDAACRWYQDNGIASIEKTPEPMRPLRAPNQKGQFLACYTSHAQPDYKGTLKGGRAIVLEAKHTATEKIEQSRITEEQTKAMEAHHRLGALVFVLVSFKLEEVYRIPWSVWRDMKQVFGRKYLTPKDIRGYRAPIKVGIPMFLGEEGLSDGDDRGML